MVERSVTTYISVAGLLLFGTITSLLAKIGMPNKISVRLLVLCVTDQLLFYTFCLDSVRAGWARSGRTQQAVPETMGDDSQYVHWHEFLYSISVPGGEEKQKACCV
jgi:hypothetical protein